MNFKIIPIKQIRDELSEVSPTMCLAKWTQGTIHLNTGHTHSCHHPATHKIPLSELETNLSALHNTKHKQKARQDMLNGIQTPECEYCWKIENLTTGDHDSDRTFKSRTSWSYPRFEEVIQSGQGSEFFPSYIEVNFDNTCNFRCLYCSPDVSSRWMEDSQRHGPYKLPHTAFNDIEYLKATDKMPYQSKEVNPYVDAFWKWWPELKQKLTHFRITGGEPLLSKNTWKLIEDLIASPQPTLDFAINTNLCVPDELIARLISKINSLDNKVARITIFTSIEGDGPEQEFVRDGMDVERFWRNVELLLDQCPNIRLAYMTTVNVFSLKTLHHLATRVVEQRAAYASDDIHKINLSFNYLRYPAFLALPTMSKAALEQCFVHWRRTLESLSNKSLYGHAALTSQESEAWERMMTWALEVPRDTAGKEDQVEFIKQVCVRRPELDANIPRWVLDN